jgi:hypothetical protein
MKLRISGNSIRLRLSRSEVALLAKDSSVEDVVHFGPDCKLSYSLSISPSTRDVSAELKSTSIKVRIPQAIADSWISTDSLTIAGEQNAGGAVPLQILIEKDLKCVHKDSVANADSYSNPLHSHLG